MNEKENVSAGAMYQSDRKFQVIMGTFFVLLSILVFIPIMHVLAVSFSSKSAILSGDVGIFPVDFTLYAYQKTIGNSSFMSSFVYSILLTTGYTVAAMVATILAAYPLSRKRLRGGNIVMTMIVLTMYFDPGIIPNYLNVKNFHLLDTVWALIIPCLISAYNMIILKTFFSSIDNALYEAAYLDGCDEIQTLTKVVLPLTLPAIATLSLFYAVSRWNGISDVMYYINDTSLFTVQMKLKQFMDSLVLVAGETVQVGYETLAPENVKAAGIVIAMLPMLIAYPFVQKYFTRGIMLGAVKG